MKIKHIALAALAAGIAAPALAQTGPEPFSGPFIGGEAGWQQDRFSVSDGNVSGSIKSDGLRYGAFAGFDFRAGAGAVVGLEVGISDSTADFDFREDGVDASIGIGRTIDVTARAGGLVSPTTLLYARGGYSNARLAAFADGEAGSGDADGWLVGAGIETMVATNVSARFEYNYSQFDGQDSGVTPKRHALKAGIAFRF